MNPRLTVDYTFSHSMASSPEAKAFQGGFNLLFDAIRHPENLNMMAIRLYSRELITAMVRNEMFTLSLSYSEKAVILLKDVEHTIKFHPKSFHQFIRTLQDDPALINVASILARNYGTFSLSVESIVYDSMPIIILLKVCLNSNCSWFLLISLQWS